MSQETSLWLATMTLIGMDKGSWHQSTDEALQNELGLEPNHYSGPLTVEDIVRRLFAPLHIIEGNVSTTYKDPITGNPVTLVDAKRKSILLQFKDQAPTEITGLFKTGYQVHPYEQWLIKNLDTITSGGAVLATAGLLKGGALAWVQAQLDTDLITTPQGVAYRPYVIAATAHDGSLSSTYNRGVTLAVCDNTVSAVLADKTQMVKVRHSRNSLNRVHEIRTTLDLISQTADDYSEQVAALCATEVTDRQWSAFLDAYVPVKDAKGDALPNRSLGSAVRKRDALSTLWTNDNRVSPWKNTAFGVEQAVNTWSHWMQNVKGDRAERNALNKVTGAWDKHDADTLALLEKVLQRA